MTQPTPDNEPTAPPEPLPPSYSSFVPTPCDPITPEGPGPVLAEKPVVTLFSLLVSTFYNNVTEKM